MHNSNGKHIHHKSNEVLWLKTDKQTSHDEKEGGYQRKNVPFFFPKKKDKQKNQSIPRLIINRQGYHHKSSYRSDKRNRPICLARNFHSDPLACLAHLNSHRCATKKRAKDNTKAR